MRLKATYKPLVYLTLGIICIFLLSAVIKYIVFYTRVHYAQPYTLAFSDPTPVQEEDMNTASWIIHKYVPLHNAGSEWMAHAMNTYLIQSSSWRVNVIANTSPVAEFERVAIYNRNQHKTIADILRHSSVLLTHHTNEPNAVRTAGIVKRPVVCIMHDHGRKDFLQEYNRLPYRKNIYLIHNSLWLKEWYSMYGFQSIVVYPPVYWQEYAVETSREYVTLINCNKNKGGETFLHIAKELPNIKFLGVKGAYNKQVVDKHSKNIEYIEQTPEIKKVYEKTGILLMPSVEESWGRTAIEAMSSGIPVIANPTPGLLESCGSAGIFCKRNDIGAWVREIRRLKEDPAYYKEKSAACLARAKELNPEPQLKAFSNWISTLKWKD
jgi:glycosyltransferase involved in cell wall biosynthesis